MAVPSGLNFEMNPVNPFEPGYEGCTTPPVVGKVDDAVTPLIYTFPDPSKATDRAYSEHALTCVPAVWPVRYDPYSRLFRSALNLARYTAEFRATPKPRQLGVTAVQLFCKAFAVVGRLFV